MKSHIRTFGTLVAAFLAFSSTASAQSDQQLINEQVWKPFTQAILDRNLDAYFAVHSHDIVRVSGRSKKVTGFDAYRQEMEKMFARTPPRDPAKPPSTFELRFTQRLGNGTAAYETGYYKNEFNRPNGERGVGYGAFQVTLRKENDRWKILVDADGFNPAPITEEMFQGAQRIE